MGDFLFTKFMLSSTYLTATFAYNIDNTLLINVRSKQSIAIGNIVTALISWLFLQMLNKVYKSVPLSSISFNKKFIASLLHVLSNLFNIIGSRNDISIILLSRIMSLPLSLLIRYLVFNTFPKITTLITLYFYLVGSIMVYFLQNISSPTDVLIAISISLLNCFKVTILEYIICFSGSGSISIQASLSITRMVASFITSFILMLYNNFNSNIDDLHVYKNIYSIPILVLLSSAELSQLISLTSLINMTSGLHCIVLEQFYYIIYIFICNAFSPLKYYSTLDMVVAFFGFITVLTAHIFFLSMSSSESKIVTGTEHFKVMDDVTSMDVKRPKTSETI